MDTVNHKKENRFLLQSRGSRLDKVFFPSAARRKIRTHLTNSVTKKPVHSARKKWLSWAKGVGLALLLLVFSLGQGLSSGMNSAASAIKTLPSIVSVGLPAFQVAISALGFFSMLINIYFAMKLMPTAIKRLRQFFSRFSTLPNAKKLLSCLTVVSAISAGLASAFFAYYSAPIAVIGMLSVFGFTAFPPLMPIALLSGFITFSTVNMLFLNSVIKLIDAFSWRKLKQYFRFSLSAFNQLNQQQRYQKIASVVARAIGILLLSAASIFTILVNGNAFMNIMTTHIGEIAAWALNISVIFVASGVLKLLLTFDTANHIFNKIGTAIGTAVFHLPTIIKQPIVMLKMTFDRISNITIGSFFTGLLFAVSLLVNGIAKFLQNSTAVSSFRSMHSYHITADSIARHANPLAPNPAAMLNEISQTEVHPPGVPEVIAGGSTTAASVTIIASTIFSPKKATKKLMDVAMAPLKSRAVFSERYASAV